MRSLTTVLAFTLLATSAGAATCQSLSALKLPAVTIGAAAETGRLSAADPMFGNYAVNDRFCKVSGTIAEGSLAAAVNRHYAAVLARWAGQPMCREPN